MLAASWPPNDELRRVTVCVCEPELETFLGCIGFVRAANSALRVEGIKVEPRRVGSPARLETACVCA